MKEVSIIINTYNRRESLRATLESILRQDYCNYEILVIDDGSSDGTKEAIDDLIRSGRIRYVCTPRLGVAGSRNRGIELARGEFFCILDSDMICTPQLLVEVIAVFDEDPQIGIVGTWPIDGGWLSYSEVLKRMGSYTGKRLEDVQGVRGCSMTISKAMVTKVGLLDERMFFGWEDADICWRAILAGFRVVYLNDILSFHMSERSSRSRLSQGQFAYEQLKNKLLTHLKLAPRRTLLECLLRELMRTIRKCVCKPFLCGSLVRAWIWNMRHLSEVLRERSGYYSGQTGNGGRKLYSLLQLDKEHDRMFRNYRLEFERAIESRP